MSMVGRALRFGGAVVGDVKDLIHREEAFRMVRPFAATIFLTYRCNSRCTTCTFWKRPHKEEKAREIDFAEWRVIIDKLHAAGVRAVEVFGGNVLIRKELLIQVLRYLREKGFVVHLPTNQIGLDDEIARAIVECVDWVYISTDGVEEYQDAIRGLRGSAEKAEDAIARLRRIRGDREPPPILVCNTTVSRFNVDILDRLAEYAEAKGFDEIHYEYAGEQSQEHLDHSLIDGLMPTPYYVKQGDETILVSRDGARRLKVNLRQVRRRTARSPLAVKSVNIDILSERHLHEGTIPHDKCYVERTEVTVDPSGNLIACPFINNYVMGDLVRGEFDAVWNNEKHRRFREVQNGGEIAMCRHCILGVQRNPGVWTTLKRIYITRLSDLRYRFLGNGRPGP
jgi:MoaA/NifB/PqqE/SkfB family radical SAM enzyme